MDVDELDAFIAGKLEMCKGKWDWSEEANDLQFISVLGQKPKKERKPLLLHPLTIRPSEKPKPDSIVTLEDVKSVAVGLISKQYVMSMGHKSTALFDHWYRTDQMNYLIWGALIYYNDFQKNNKLKSIKEFRYLELCESRNKHAQSDSDKRLGQALANVSQAYTNFLLKDISSSKVAGSQHSQHTDQMAYEVLYEFIMRVLWICYGYKDWETIHKEIGKIFKTDAYNREIAEGHVGDLCEKVDNSIYPGFTSTQQSSSYSFYKAHHLRPTISSLKITRSPAIACLFPMPQEKGCHLISRKPHHTIKQTKLFPPTMISPPSRLGIIGDNFYKYETKTLKLLHATKKKQMELDDVGDKKNTNE